MRMSRKITLTLLGGLTLTGCLAASGCGPAGGRPDPAEAPEPPDRTWYDDNGNVIPEKWKTDAQGNRVLDEEGRPIPEPTVPRDRHGRPWVYSNGMWGPLVVLASSPHYRSPARSSSFLTGGSGYRSTSTTTTYRAPSGTGSSSFRSAPSSAPASGSSITRGGFGSTGSGAAASSSS